MIITIINPYINTLLLSTNNFFRLLDVEDELEDGLEDEVEDEVEDGLEDGLEDELEDERAFRYL